MTTARRGGVPDPAGGDGQPARSHPSRSPGDALPADSRLARELLDGLTEAIVTTDGAGRVTLVNATATELLPEVVAGTELPTRAVAAFAHAAREREDAFDAGTGAAGCAAYGATWAPGGTPGTC